jgi:hypothetical protein
MVQQLPVRFGGDSFQPMVNVGKDADDRSNKAFVVATTIILYKIYNSRSVGTVVCLSHPLQKRSP